MLKIGLLEIIPVTRRRGEKEIQRPLKARLVVQWELSFLIFQSRLDDFSTSIGFKVKETCKFDSFSKRILTFMAPLTCWTWTWRSSRRQHACLNYLTSLETMKYLRKNENKLENNFILSFHRFGRLWRWSVRPPIHPRFRGCRTWSMCVSSLRNLKLMFILKH